MYHILLLNPTQENAFYHLLTLSVLASFMKGANFFLPWEYECNPKYFLGFEQLNPG